MAGEQEIVARDFLGIGKRDGDWNKAVSLQHLLSLRHVQEGSMFEKNPQSPLKWLAPHSLPDFGKSGLGNGFCNQDPGKSGLGNGFCNQGFTLDHNAHVDHGDNKGIVPETMLSLSVSNANEQVLPASVFKAQPVMERGSSTLFRPVGQFSYPGSSSSSVLVFGDLPASTHTRLPSSDAFGQQHSAQLTIFYAGNVNVYDDVSKDKAKEIMHLAGSGSSLPTKVLNPSAAGQCNPFKLSNAAAPQVGPVSPQVGHKMSGSRQENLQLNLQTIPSGVNTHPVQAAPIPPTANKNPECLEANTCLPASSSLPSGQPVVPRALPQARKASLARFLEKRKERVKSKSPYSMNNFSPEQLLPEERFSSSNYDALSRTSFDDGVDKKPISRLCGMEEMTGTFEATSICDIDATEEIKICSAESQMVTEGGVTE